MPRLEYFLVASSVSIDQSTNRVSVFEIIEEIRGPTFPLRIPSCAAITLWCAEDGDQDTDFQAMLRVYMPDGRTNEFATNFRLAMPRHRITQRFQGLTISGPGELRFEMLLNGEHKADHLVTVLPTESDPATPTPPPPVA